MSSTDEIVARLERSAKKGFDPKQARVRDAVNTLQGKASPELQAAQAPQPPEELVGGETAKEKTGRRYRQRRPSEPRG